ncbi:hypothetical protein LNTAR_24928 [Lentisphaera araneosa HTCC2155]|jgi:hypothetical protein|uniref:Uncharacterized protein n=1 Tax=Lentisphaera araneosa HTCC2155 TaxID=313628 RepID=A6DSZ3_9BACT|nr:hypothetical protein [Lentisphaera araneosa]EDM25283.1 hypothetical protein LNTAR_24928 [Lentisphaera araneosa HTCC2155]
MKQHFILIFFVFSSAIANEKPHVKVEVLDILKSNVLSELTKKHPQLKSMYTTFHETDLDLICYLEEKNGAIYSPLTKVSLHSGFVINKSVDSNHFYIELTAAPGKRKEYKNKFGDTCILTVKYKRKNKKGILIIPVWVDINRSNLKELSINSWHIIEDELWHVEKEIEKI